MSRDPEQSSAHAAGVSDDAFERELGRRLREGDAPAPALTGLFGEIERELAQEHGLRAWLRSRPTPVRVALALGALLVPAAVAGAFALRPDAALYPPARMLAVAVFLAASLVALARIGLRPLQRPALPDAAALGAVAASALGLLALYALPDAHAAHPASLQAPGVAALLARAWPCLWIGSAAGALVLCVLLAIDRGGARRALLLAAAAGLCANLALQLHCPNTARAHLVLAHFGVLALLLLATALAGRRGGAARDRRAARD
jgi:hypothetical protein